MKLAVLADLHLGNGPRAEESRRIQGWVLSTLEARRPDALLLAGDIFDHGTHPDERIEGADLLRSLAEIAPVVGVAGNHDARGEVGLFNRLATKHPITLSEVPGVHVVGDAAVALLPWMRDPPKLEVTRLSPVERRAAEEQALRAQLARLGDEADAAGRRTKILVGHLMLKEADVKVGQPERRGGEFLLGLDELALVRAHAYALGHVHASQEWDIAGAPVFYPGSTIRRTFGEIERKYIALLHCDGPRVSVEWVECPTRPMILAETRWLEIEPGRWGFDLDEPAALAEADGAEVRITYDVGEERRAAAQIAATELAAKLKAAGAAVAKPEERVTPSLRARAPEIARTSSLRDKLAIALASRGCEAATDQYRRVLDLFDAEVHTADARVDAADPVARLRSIRARGLGPAYASSEVVLDIDELRGELVAVVGANGAGKSTLLEAFPGALHPQRKTPTRGTLDSLADDYGREAFVEIVASSSQHTYRVRQELGRGQAFIWRDDEVVPTDGGKVSRAAEWMRATQLAPEVLTSAIFLGQRSEGLIAADGADRRAALLRAIGIEAIEALAEKARKLVREAEKALGELRSEIARLRAVTTSEQAAEHHASALRALAAAEERHARATAQVEATRASQAAYEARERERLAAVTRQRAADQRLDDCKRRVAGLEARLVEQHQVLARGAEIRARATQVRDIDARISARLSAAPVARGEAAQAAADAGTANQGAEAEGTRWRAARTRRKELERVLADRPAVEAAVAGLPLLRSLAEGAAQALDEATARLEATAFSGTATRIDALSGALVTVSAAAELDEAHATARAALAADAEAVAASSAIPGLRSEVDALRVARAKADRELRAAELLAARSGEVLAAIDADRAATDEMAIAEQRGRLARDYAKKRRADAEEADRCAAAIEAEVAALRREAAAFADDLAREGALAGAEARVAEIEEQLAGARTDQSAAQEQLAGLPQPAEALLKPDASAADGELAAASRAIASESSRLSLAERDLAAARENARKLADAMAKLPLAENRLADLTLLADALGLSGVQALEIDAAGPALTSAMNEILHRSFGPRFTAEVTASRKSKDGKKTIDECQILVLDTVKKTPKRDISTYSGGERVPLATAFFLALAVYLCRSRGLDAPTLTLDEPGAGLDDEHVGPWIDMLRMAARMAGASKTIVITHDKRVIDAADTVLEVKDGAVAMVR